MIKPWMNLDVARFVGQHAWNGLAVQERHDERQERQHQDHDQQQGEVAA